MKNKKTLVGIVLLIVVLALGIGYAAITSSLTISGTATATANENNFKVVFTGETSGVSEGVTVDVEENSKSAELNVTGLTTKGQTGTATFTIQNQSGELNADVKVKTATINNSDFFKVTSTVAQEKGLKPEDKTTVTVTVELIKTPIETVTGTISVELGAEAALGN